MSLSKLEEVRCPCGKVFHAELWSSIDAVAHPDLKEELISGEINVVCCPECEEIFHAEHFILYHDSENEVIAFVYPSTFSSQYEYWSLKMENDFKNAMENFSSEEKLDYKPILLFGLDSLVELIHGYDEENDEAAILEYMAEELGLSLISIRPYIARSKRLIKLLPRIPSKENDIRNEILEGLERLLRHNSQLLKYKDVYDVIKKDENWVLDKKLIKKSVK